MAFVHTDTKSFEPFGRLPSELRLAIWEMALDGIPERLFHVKQRRVSETGQAVLEFWRRPRLPPQLQVCHEARQAACQQYILTLPTYGDGSWARFHPDRDILYFEYMYSNWGPESDREAERIISPDAGLDGVRNIGIHELVPYHTAARRMTRDALRTRFPYMKKLIYVTPELPRLPSKFSGRGWESEPDCCRRRPGLVVPMEDLQALSSLPLGTSTWTRYRLFLNRFLGLGRRGVVIEGRVIIREMCEGKGAGRGHCPRLGTRGLSNTYCSFVLTNWTFPDHIVI
jgi:hypothetical protein